ncbi:MAG TPA: YlxR family protein [Myxococcales bacterium]|nr:YlxR family protein [Myxococcales bacterium]
MRPAEPQRRCVGCRRVRPRRELMRLAVEGGEVVEGLGKPGRGCWICRDAGCAQEAVKRREIPRALKGKGAPPTLHRLLGWMGLGSLDGDGGRRLKS